MKTYTEPPLTLADLEAAPDDGNRYELIEGELHVSSAPSIFHQRLTIRIIAAFLDYLRRHPVGELLPGVGVIFDDFSAVIPDLVFVTHERLERSEADGRLKSAPEIVIEILSPGTSNERRDRQLKRDLYSRQGVHEYWIVDPIARAIELHRKRKTGGLEFIARLQSGDELTSTVLPEFTLPVDSLF
jgi:Uma2 family endonuclease